jgi:hypothetical protein
MELATFRVKQIRTFNLSPDIAASQLSDTGAITISAFIHLRSRQPITDPSWLRIAALCYV